MMRLGDSVRSEISINFDIITVYFKKKKEFSNFYDYKSRPSFNTINKFTKIIILNKF